MTDLPGLAGIWEELRGYLRVEVKLTEEQGSRHCLIEFNVTNSAQASPEHADIIFEEVMLRIGMPPNWHVEKETNLGCGKSFLRQFRCPTSDLTKLQYRVDGRVSPSVLSEVWGRPTAIPRTDRNRLSALAYLAVLDETDVHQWLERTLTNLPAPGPDTTLSQVKASQASLEEARRQIAEAQERLLAIMGLIIPEHRENVVEHKRLVEEYLKRTTEACSSLLSSLARPQDTHLTALRDSVVTRLREEAAKLDKATDELRQKVSAPRR